MLGSAQKDSFHCLSIEVTSQLLFSFMLGLNGLRLIQKRFSIIIDRTSTFIPTQTTCRPMSSFAPALTPDTMSPTTTTTTTTTPPSPSQLAAAVDNTSNNMMAALSLSEMTIAETSTSEYTISTAAATGSQRWSASGRALEPRRIQQPIAVAPMVDVTTSHFLHLCRIISPNYTLYTEMIHCNAVVYNPNDLYNFFGEPWEGKVVQLGGSDLESMAKAAKLVQDNGYKEVNLNVGCPSPRVQKGAFGAVLMKTPSTVVDIIQEMVKIGVTIPITVKCRIGVDNLDSYEYLHDFIKLISTTTPVTHFIVHARKCWLKGLSPKQNRSVPPLKHEVVYQLAKDFPDLTITINGGFHTTTQIKEQLNLVDGVMVGREVMDRPMFLTQVDAAYHSVPPENIKSTEEVIDEFLDYVLTQHERGTPHSNSVVMAPLKMLYGGRRGKEYRRRLAALILPRTKPLPDIVRDMREMMQEMDFSRPVTEADSEAEEEDVVENPALANSCAQ